MRPVPVPSIGAPPITLVKHNIHSDVRGYINIESREDHQCGRTGENKLRGMWPERLSLTRESCGGQKDGPGKH
ncbi:MAG: hypothetical protein P4L42_09820 [Desulfocapsaceae bacterium]|nr:hypothetical protein [Desulfocapsaceae bacterium]